MRSHKWERLNIARMNRIDGVVKMFDELGRCYLFMIIPQPTNCLAGLPEH